MHDDAGAAERCLHRSVRPGCRQHLRRVRRRPRRYGPHRVARIADPAAADVRPCRPAPAPRMIGRRYHQGARSALVQVKLDDPSKPADGGQRYAPMTVPLVIATTLREQGITGVHTHMRQLLGYLDRLGTPATLVTS